MSSLRLLGCVAVGLALSGCHGPRIVDDVDLTFDWHPIRRPNVLHTPYVVGAEFGLYTEGVDADHLGGWYFESEDPAAFRIDSTSDGHASVSALEVGLTRVSLHDAGGRRRRTATMDVRQPDGAELAAHGPLILGRPDLQEDFDEILVLAGGSATFEVRWLEGSTRLHGHGTLTVVAAGDIVVEPRTTFLFEDREWVTFTPGSVGSYDVELRADGQPVRTVRVVAVTEAEVDGMTLLGEDERGAHDGDLLAVLAQAYAVDGRPIFGVQYAWDLDGDPQDGLGDLYRYEYAAHAEGTLCARFGGLEATAVIHGADGYVDSTSNLGCAVAGPGVPAGGAPLLPLVAAALLVGRLRRRRAG